MKKSKFIVLLLLFSVCSQVYGCTTGGGHPQGCIESAPWIKYWWWRTVEIGVLPRKLPGGY